MQTLRPCVILVALMLWLRTLASGQTPPPTAPAAAPAILRTLFTAKNVDGSLFSSSFTTQVPTSTVQAIVEAYRMRLGTFVSVEPVGTDFAVLFQGGSVLATIALDPSAKITGLLLHDEISPGLRKALERFLTAKTILPAWFSAAFLAQVPLAQIQSITDQVRGQEGAYLRLDEREHRYVAVFEKAENSMLGSLDDGGRFSVLRIGPPVTRTSNLSAVERAIDDNYNASG